VGARGPVPVIGQFTLAQIDRVVGPRTRLQPARIVLRLAQDQT
jgi:hypothetical protein